MTRSAWHCLPLAVLLGCAPRAPAPEAPPPTPPSAAQVPVVPAPAANTAAPPASPRPPATAPGTSAPSTPSSPPRSSRPPPAVAQAPKAPAAAPSKAPAAAPKAPAPAPSVAAVKPAPPAATVGPAAPAAPPLDLKSLERRLKETPAIGVMTKLSLKNQVDDLVDRFRDYYEGRLRVSLAELRRPYDLLVMKVLTLLQDGDPELARAIHASREALWAMLADREKFQRLTA